MSRSIGSVLALAQVALGLRVVWRLARTGGQEPIRAVYSSCPAVEPASVAIVVPVLNEVARLAACPDGILAQGAEVGEILLVDRGSSDGTRDLVRAYVLPDRPVRLVAAGSAPRHADWSGPRLPAAARDVLAHPDIRPAGCSRAVAERAASAPHLAQARLRSKKWSSGGRMSVQSHRNLNLTLGKVAGALLAGHGAALVFGLGGMLVALPHPELWSASPLGQQAFAFGMQYAGPLHMVFGAAAMLAVGTATLGWRRTAIFFGLACGLSLASELIGTGTGFPFGNYEYTAGLGYKILGRVPFSIPLSWFYMGLASFVLGGTLARWHPMWSVALGAYFLTVWDLVLDPAMAHPGLALNFWIWHQSGPYFGMPVLNFVGWTATGALFMGLSRWLWGSRVPVIPWRLPLAVYVMNMVFAMVLSAAGGVWEPIGLALICALAGGVLAASRRPALRLAPHPST